MDIRKKAKLAGLFVAASASLLAILFLFIANSDLGGQVARLQAKGEALRKEVRELEARNDKLSKENHTVVRLRQEIESAQRTIEIQRGLLKNADASTGTVSKEREPAVALPEPKNGLSLSTLSARSKSSSDRTASNAVPVTSDEEIVEVLNHLEVDERPISGEIFSDKLTERKGKGKLTLSNGLKEDAFVKVIQADRLVLSFYVRGGEEFSFSAFPDGVFTVMYSLGYGWNSTSKDYVRGRRAAKYDAPLDFETTQKKEGAYLVTSTKVFSLTLHKVKNGNASTSDIELTEFDRF